MLPCWVIKISHHLSYELICSCDCFPAASQMTFQRKRICFTGSVAQGGDLRCLWSSRRQSWEQSPVLLTINPGPLTTRCSSLSQPLILRSSTGVSALQLLAAGCFFSRNRWLKSSEVSNIQFIQTPKPHSWSDQRTDVHLIYILGPSEEGLKQVSISHCFDAPGFPTPICCRALKTWKFPLPVPPPGCVHWYSPPPQCTDVTLCTEFQLVGRGYSPHAEIH